MSHIIEITEKAAIKQADKNFPPFRPGDTVAVHYRVQEGNTNRIQIYQGVCIERRNRALGSHFTVRKISYGEGVERVFPMYSPFVEKVDLIQMGKVRRAKLFYLRHLSGKASRIPEKKRKI